jgi:hypothetical protein
MNWRSPQAMTIGGTIAAVLIALGGGLWFFVLRPQAPDAGQAVTPTASVAANASTLPANPTSAISTRAVLPAGTPTSTPEYLTIAGSPVPTTVPPLNTLPFLGSPVAYPPDWPGDLRLPQLFVPLEVTSGTYLDGKTQAWAMKLRYRGTRQGAEADLIAFYQQRGWATERLETRSGTTVIGIRRNNGQQTGSFVLSADPDDPAATRIIGTIRL